MSKGFLNKEGTRLIRYVCICDNKSQTKLVSVSKRVSLGVVYKYGKVSFGKEEDENGNL